MAIHYVQPNIGNLTNTFHRNFYSKKRIVVNRGGTRSSKTYSICQLLVNWLLTGIIRDGQVIPKGVAHIVRKNRSTASDTVQITFDNILESVTVNEKEIFEYLINSKNLKINKSKKTYKYDGRTVKIIGADKQQKLKGIESEILYCNEADELAFKKEFFQLNTRTKYVTFIDFNPSDPHVWINEEIEQKRAARRNDVDVIVSTYRDNEQNLTQEQIDEIEDLKETAPDLWDVYGKGEYGIIKGLIFPKIYTIDKMPSGLRREAYGQDFGYTNDPTTLYHCGTKGKNLYIDELCYRKGMLTYDIQSMYSANGLSKSDEIFADSAEPRLIDDLGLYGWNVKGAKKGRDSIRFGINQLKGYKIHVTSRSSGILKEFKKYKWKVDRSGNMVKDSNGKTIPIDAWNHGIDSIRYYAIEMLDQPVFQRKLNAETF